MTDGLSMAAAARIVNEARQKFAAAASLINDGRNMMKALNAAGYRTRDIQAMLPTLDDAQNACERCVSMCDSIRGRSTSPRCCSRSHGSSRRSGSRSCGRRYASPRATRAA